MSFSITYCYVPLLCGAAIKGASLNVQTPRDHRPSSPALSKTRARVDAQANTRRGEAAPSLLQPRNRGDHGPQNAGLRCGRYRTRRQLASSLDLKSHHHCHHRHQPHHHRLVSLPRHFPWRVASPLCLCPRPPGPDGPPSLHPERWNRNDNPSCFYRYYYCCRARRATWFNVGRRHPGRCWGVCRREQPSRALPATPSAATAAATMAGQK